MDIKSIQIRKDGTTIGDLKSFEDAQIAEIELEFEISALKTDLDESWADRAERGISTSPSWLSDTRAELRELEIARNALRLYSKRMKANAIQDKVRVRQTILIEAAQEMMPEDQWMKVVELFRYRMNLFAAGEYTPRGWTIKDNTRAGEAA